MTTRVLLVLLVIGLVRPLVAQGPGRLGLSAAPSTSTTGERRPFQHAIDSIPPSHWKTGAIVGGAIGFPLGFVGFSSLGEGHTGEHIKNGFLGGIGTALIFALIGGLIGSLFPSHPNAA